MFSGWFLVCRKGGQVCIGHIRTGHLLTSQKEKKEWNHDIGKKRLDIGKCQSLP